ATTNNPPMSAAALRPASSLRSATTTRAPCSVRTRATASPIPDAAPLTTATFPSRWVIRRLLQRPEAAAPAADRKEQRGGRAGSAGRPEHDQARLNGASEASE